MISKNKIKYIRSLKEKKNRDESGTFVVEGNKMVTELLPKLKCKLLIATTDILKSIDTRFIEEVLEVEDNELAKVSFLKNPQQSLAVFYKDIDLDICNIEDTLSLVLDQIQDPGNLGTIVRIADWYGIENIICSNDTADIYNPKTVQATMGALARVKITYTELSEFLKQNSNLPIYGTFLDGEDIYTNEITRNGIIIMGNEGNGISKKIEKYVNKRLYIPSFPTDKETSESLNVAVATAITCAEFRRRLR